MIQKRLALGASADPGLSQTLMRRRIADGLKAVRSSKSDAPDRNLNIPAGDLTDINVVGPLAAKLPDDYSTAKIMIHNPVHQIIRPRLARTNSAYINSWRATALSAARIGQSTGVSIEQNGTSVFLRVWAPACAVVQISPDLRPSNSPHGG